MSYSNRYSPLESTAAASPPLLAVAVRPYPVFCVVVFAIDLIMCVIRVALVPLTVIGYFALRGGNEAMASMAIAEAATGLGIVVTGIPANIAMLCRQRWGRVLAIAAATFTGCSLAVGFIQIAFSVPKVPPGSPEMVGFFVGAAFMVIIRISLLGLFLAAVTVFTNWRDEQDRAEAASAE